MAAKGVMGYLGGAVGGAVEKTAGMLMPDRSDDSQGRKSSSVLSFLYKTAIFSGIVATSYYLGRDSTKPHGLVSQMLGKKRVNKARFMECVLHCYDHCTDTMKVELVLAFLGVPYTRVLYGYGDQDSPRRSVGKKKLPVLQFDRNTEENAMSIIEMLDTNTTHRSIPPSTGRQDTAQWLKDVKQVCRDLTLPRIIHMPVKDWADTRDVTFAKNKYEKNGFKFSNANARSDKLIRKMNEYLERFDDKILYDENSVNEFGFGMDDLDILPCLRKLSCVKGLKWPQKTRQYVEKAFRDTDAEPYFKHAR